ncbi:hypothetical protein PSTT_07837 [Puccinia striiformis]|uniref:Glycosyltransferase family 69 protein n=2 Tax=Puccinia striiformis TaxID=27350 RepID=A0A2S4VET9_9BASI|nr:hypothetical protein PSTT_07837 [Puccinia striiformis]
MPYSQDHGTAGSDEDSKPLLNGNKHHHHQRKNKPYRRHQRITKVLILYLVLITSLGLVYQRYLHRLIFIDYDAFPERTGRVIINPGIDPELNLSPVYINRTDTDQNLLIDKAIHELAKRLKSVYIQPSTLECHPSSETERLIRTRFLDNKGLPKGDHQVMIALNLHSSQDSLSAITNAILNSLRYLGTSNVFVSIYENGSWDHTPEGIGQFGAILTSLNIPHHFRTAQEDTIWDGVDRISILSGYRNLALSPGFKMADKALNGGLSEVVFINDVFLCYQDILEVIWERNLQHADASCGTDWRGSKSILEEYGITKKKSPALSPQNRKQSLVLYDSWVPRSLSGKTLRPRLDILTEYRDGYSVIFDQEKREEPHDLYQQRFQNNVAVPVYSCWNGIVSLSPKPFREGIKFRAADRKIGECPSSECQLLAKDFWSLGFNKWILVPKVAVTYSQDLYHSQALIDGSNRNHNRSIHSSLSEDDDQSWNEIIDWKRYLKPETVVCWPDMYKFHIDFEWNHVFESPYNPKLLKNSSSSLSDTTTSQYFN